MDNPTIDKLELLLTGTTANNGYGKNFTIEPEPALLIFWPSHIRHGIHTSKSDKVRRSLSCNFFPKGGYGNADSYIDTKWLNS